MTEGRREIEVVAVAIPQAHGVVTRMPPDVLELERGDALKDALGIVEAHQSLFEHFAKTLHTDVVGDKCLLPSLVLDREETKQPNRARFLDRNHFADAIGLI